MAKLSNFNKKVNLFAVGGGSVFSPGGAAVGTSEALALALVPAGLTPVAFFPPTPNQRMKATSVIFSEPFIQRRKDRSLKHDIRRHQKINNRMRNNSLCKLLGQRLSLN